MKGELVGSCYLTSILENNVKFYLHSFQRHKQEVAQIKSASSGLQKKKKLN